MKRILTLIIALCIVAGLTGCPAAPLPQEAPKTDPEAKFKKYAENESRLVQVGFPVRAEHVQIIVVKDKDTGAEYLVCYSGHGIAVCPLKSNEGK